MPSVRQRKFARASILLHDVGHQAKVAFDEDVSGIFVSGGGKGQVVPLLLGGEGPGKAAGGKLQRAQQGAEQQPNRAEHISTSTATLCAPARPFSAGYQRPHSNCGGINGCLP